MAAAEEVRFSLKVMIIKGSYKVLYAEVDSDFADVLLSFLTMPLGTIVRLLIKNYEDDVPILGSLNSLYEGLLNLDSSHFWTEAGKLMLLNPRNSSGIQCSRLKFQIDDTPSIQCFVCGNRTCVSMHNHAKCLCSNSTRTMTRRNFEIEPQSGEIGVFTTPKASFFLTDDLQILTNSPASLLRILKLNGVEDTNILEERTLNVGRKEIMELLKGSLVSKTPLTDIILCISTVAATSNNRKRFSSSTCVPDALRRTRTQTTETVRSDSKKIMVKALVQKSTNRILFAQTRHDFVDFLFSFLTIPIGRVHFLLGSNTCLGSVSNIYRSISNLEIGEYMKSGEAITKLLEPQLPPHYISSCQIFSLDQQKSPELYRLYKSNRVKLFVSTPIDIWRKMKMIDPKGQDCFVKGPTTFMVTDDLVVSTPSSTSMISILNQMKIPLSDVEEQEFDIGTKEALSILKASLTSARALTEGLKPFLKKQPNILFIDDKKKGASSSSQETQSLREEVEQQKRVIEFMRVDIQASQRRKDEMRSRMSSMEDQIRFLVTGTPQVPSTHPHTQSHVRGRSRIGSRTLTASTSRGAPFTSSYSRPDVRGKVLRRDSSSYRGSPPPHRGFSQQWVDPSQGFGGDDDDDDDGDAGAYYDDDETHAP